VLHRFEQQAALAVPPAAFKFPKRLGDQVRNDSVSVSERKTTPSGLQLLTQLAVILDDAVSGPRPALGPSNGGGIAFLRLAMGWPARLWAMPH